MSVQESHKPPHRPYDLRAPYSGYHLRELPPEDGELTHTSPGTPCGGVHAAVLAASLPLAGTHGPAIGDPHPGRGPGRLPRQIGRGRRAAPSLQPSRHLARIRHRLRALHSLLLSRLAVRHRRHHPGDPGRATRLPLARRPPPRRLRGARALGPGLRLHGSARRPARVPGIRDLRDARRRHRPLLHLAPLQLAAMSRQLHGPGPCRVPAQPHQRRSADSRLGKVPVVDWYETAAATASSTSPPGG